MLANLGDGVYEKDGSDNANSARDATKGKGGIVGASRNGDTLGVVEEQKAARTTLFEA